jgi:hypothetical protein
LFKISPEDLFRDAAGSLSAQAESLLVQTAKTNIKRKRENR